MITFFILLLCSLIFTTESFASVLVEGDSVSLASNAGDTVSLIARTRLNYGENLVKWELVSGQGVFLDATNNSRSQGQRLGWRLWNPTLYRRQR